MDLFMRSIGRQTGSILANPGRHRHAAVDPGLPRL